MVPRSVATHDGPFHADEVTACALLLIFNRVDRDKIVRSRKPSRLAECEYVCDVGGIYDPSRKAFDHHQADYQGLLSSAGMVWKYFRETGVVDEGLYTHLNELLILGVDAHDNGRSLTPKGVATFSHIISSYTPLTYDATAEEYEAAFYKALDFVVGYLQRLLAHHEQVLKARSDVEAAMRGSQNVLIFERRLPWLESFFALGGESHPALFVIMPTGEGWKLRGIPPNEENKMGIRMPLPKEWAGLIGEELKRASGIPGAIFCHKGRFISVWETKEDALTALNYVLKERERAHYI